MFHSRHASNLTLRLLAACTLVLGGSRASANSLPGNVIRAPNCLASSELVPEYAHPLQLALAKCAATATSGFSSCKGAPRPYKMENGRLYSLSIQLPNQVDAVLWIPRDGTRSAGVSIDGLLQVGEDGSAADTVFQRYRAALRGLCSNPDEVFRESSAGPYSKIASIANYRGLDIALTEISRTSHNGRGQRYGVDLQVIRLNPLLLDLQGPNETPEASCRRSPVSGSDSGALTFVYALDKMALAAKEGFMSLRRKDSSAPTDSGGSKSIAAELPIAGASEATIDLGRDPEAAIRVLVGKHLSVEKARERYIQTITSVNVMCPETGMNKVSDHDENRPGLMGWWIFNFTPQVSIEADLVPLDPEPKFLDVYLQLMTRRVWLEPSAPGLQK